MRRRHRGEKVKEDLSRGWLGRGGCLPVSFGMFGMLWGRHAASRIQQQKQRPRVSHDDGSQTPDLGAGTAARLSSAPRSPWFRTAVVWPTRIRSTAVGGVPSTVVPRSAQGFVHCREWARAQQQKQRRDARADTSRPPAEAEGQGKDKASTCL